MPTGQYVQFRSSWTGWFPRLDLDSWLFEVYVFLKFCFRTHTAVKVFLHGQPAQVVFSENIFPKLQEPVLLVRGSYGSNPTLYAKLSRPMHVFVKPPERLHLCGLVCCNPSMDCLLSLIIAKRDDFAFISLAIIEIDAFFSCCRRSGRREECYPPRNEPVELQWLGGADWDHRETGRKSR